MNTYGVFRNGTILVTCPDKASAIRLANGKVFGGGFVVRFTFGAWVRV